MTDASDAIDLTARPSGDGCLECDAHGTWWFHLRRCAKCGQIACCDSSPSQHASAHAEQAGHPIVTSFEPGEDWFWDYASQDYYDGPQLPDPQHHPIDQPTPGPADRVPDDWQTKVQ